jgi:polyribonucleotide nucleotidyltransferase
MPYGAFVEFMPGKDGLLHISEIDWKRFDTMEETGLKEGDTIAVKLVDIDPKTGKFKLSHRVLLDKPEGYEERPPRSERPQRNDRGDRGDRGPRGDRGDRGGRPDRGPRHDHQDRGPRRDRQDRPNYQDRPNEQDNNMNFQNGPDFDGDQE